jgi:hypothetical protein
MVIEDPRKLKGELIMDEKKPSELIKDAELSEGLLDNVTGGMSELEYMEFYSNVVMPLIDRKGIGHGDVQAQNELEQKLLAQYSPDKSLDNYKL